MASARLSMHQTVDEIAYSSKFPSLLRAAPTPPLGFIARLVIHERYRGSGVSLEFDRIREERARQEGCGTLFAFAGDKRLRSLCRRGWQALGASDYPDAHPLKGQQAIIKPLD